MTNDDFRLPFPTEPHPYLVLVDDGRLLTLMATHALALHDALREHLHHDPDTQPSVHIQRAWRIGNEVHVTDA